MSPQYLFVLINVIGGVAVIGGYALGLSMYSEHREALWGGIQGHLRNGFTTSMLFAATGYLTFCSATIFKGGADGFGVNQIFGQYSLSILSAIFLLSASLWMPTTIAFVHTGVSYWWGIAVFSLWITALSLLWMTGMVAFSDVQSISGIIKYSSLIGLAYITFHCMILDAVCWVWLFNK